MMPHPHALLAILQDAAAHAPKHAGGLKHFTEVTRQFFERFGLWGLAAIALLDSALLPMPWQVLLISSVHDHPQTYLAYPLVAATASALGSLVPFFVGRVGGELFLLGKINRKRYEKLRDRFERQEFLAVFIPALGPPPTPIKLFEFCAGVFEMKWVPFLLAMFLGKIVQFVVYAVVTHYYGPAALGVMVHSVTGHMHLVLTICGLVFAFIALWVLRKVFDRRRGTRLPIEEDDEGTSTIVEE